MDSSIEWILLEPPGSLSSEDMCRIWVSKFPVTVAEYQAFVDAGGYHDQAYWSERGWAWRVKTGFTQPSYWGKDGYTGRRLPVTGVSFWEAEAFACFMKADLPNEIEWRSIASNYGRTRYPWGDSYDEGGSPPRANLNFFGALGDPGRVEVESFPAGQSLAGVWDLLGNVSEWCIPGHDLQLAPERATGGVLCGGCSWHTAMAVDSTFRDEVTLTTRDNQTGIRLIRRLDVKQDRQEVSPRRQLAGSRIARARPIARPTAPFRQEGIPEQIEERDWRLSVRGLVERPILLSLEELRTKFPCSVIRGLFVCVCRWGDVNEFAGVALQDLVSYVRPTCDVGDLYLHQRSVAGPGGRIYETWISLGEALQHNALLSYEMDGRPLSMELGWPLRMIDLYLYGYKLVKCLSEIVFTRDAQAGWWEQECQYDTHGVIRPGRITVVGSKPYSRDIEGEGLVDYD